MLRSRSSHHPRRVGSAAKSAGVALCLLQGCAYEAGQDDVADPEVGSESSAWSISSCATATAHQTLQNKIDPGIMTGTNYNRCGYSYVVDVNNAQLSPIYYQYFDAHWNSGTTSYSQAACTQSSSSDSSYLWMGAYLYEKQGSTWVYKETKEDFGQWKTSGSCWNPNGWVSAPCCEPPSLLLGSPSGGTVVNGRSYRVAATARQYGGDCAFTSLGFCQIPMHILNQRR